MASSGSRRRVEHARTGTGNINGTSEADVTVTWPTAFADTNYSVMAIVEIDEDGESLRVRRVRSRTTTGCVVNVVNNALTTKSGTVHAMASPDG